jgi:uncharacterized phage protein gp47/JayE
VFSLLIHEGRDGYNVVRKYEGKEKAMARKAKRPVKKKVSAKKPAKKQVSAKKSVQKKTSRVTAVKKTARAAVKSVRKTTAAARKAGTRIVRRAVEVVATVAAPLMPGGGDEKTKAD